MNTEEIIIDVTGGKVGVVELSNGMPIPGESKLLSLTDNTLTVEEKAQVQAVIVLIKQKANLNFALINRRCSCRESNYKGFNRK